ncbi:MAG: 2-dehydropantoate 2-reductase [Candidatus Woesearchaeota archaeon]|jgi:2-dehydropantoate 2-reductase|nr:2-dehydropantoate 2-reductase [Candidatus Woesearchaeota archaeon]|tara:strand:- start:126291 stop:127169 length:879 start_codon:yes stop_codon:yes gene_type:complete
MKIIILGAGGIGSLVGALLSKDNDVLLVGNKAHTDEIKKNGLQITGCIDKSFKIKADTKINKIEDNTLIILTTKAVDNEKSINQIKNLIKKNTLILCLQNGLGNEDLLRKQATCRVIRGITTAGTTFLEPGKVICSNIGNIYVEDSEASGDIVNILDEAGLKAEISKDIKERIWKKLIANCIMNTLSAIFKVKNGQLSKSPKLIKSIVKELVEVAEKEHFKFKEEETFDMVMEIIKQSAENKSSMLQDILKGKKTEIDFLNGKIVELAEKHKVDVPVNKALVDMIKFLESKD